MQNIKNSYWLLSLLCCFTTVNAQTVTVKAMRFSTQDNEARMVFDMSGTTQQNVSLLQNPPRIVINIENAALDRKIRQPSHANVFIEDVLTTETNDHQVEITVSLKKAVGYKSFMLDANKRSGARLVVDIFDAPAAPTFSAKSKDISNIRTSEKFAANSVSANVSNSSPKFSAPQSSKFDLKNPETKSREPAGAYSVEIKNTQTAASKPFKSDTANSRLNEDESDGPLLTTKSSAPSKREIVVAIDAGHGGEDSGAHGPNGTAEKAVVFQIAKKLEGMIRRQPGMKAVMVRGGDYFIKLRNRMRIARNAKADLFVSIHADAFTSPNAKGASVYTLSNHGASSEAARWLADSENAADLVGGVSLDDKDDMLASVLLDLSQTATTEASSLVASKVLSNFRTVNSLHKSSVQKAGFMVLKSPDIPSILVETAFISNPNEEQKLRSSDHQHKVAKAIFNGIVAYFKQNVPLAAPVRIAKTSKSPVKNTLSRHFVGPGETLAGIAQRYGVSPRNLKSANMLATSIVRVGQKLRIPVDS